MKINDKINLHLQEADRLALAELERIARRILRRNKRLDEFVMAMGSATFTIKNSREQIGYSWSMPKYAKPLFDFLDEWDRILRLSGTPMRFTADGAKRTNW